MLREELGAEPLGGGAIAAQEQRADPEDGRLGTKRAPRKLRVVGIEERAPRTRRHSRRASPSRRRGARPRARSTRSQRARGSPEPRSVPALGAGRVTACRRRDVRQRVRRHDGLALVIRVRCRRGLRVLRRHLARGLRQAGDATSRALDHERGHENTEPDRRGSHEDRARPQPPGRRGARRCARDRRRGHRRQGLAREIGRRSLVTAEPEDRRSSGEPLSKRRFGSFMASSDSRSAFASRLPGTVLGRVAVVRRRSPSVCR